EPVHFTHVVLDDLAARDMLKHYKREREIDLQWGADSKTARPAAGNYGEVLTIVSKYVRVGRIRHSLFRPAHHFAADIHCINVPEEAGQGARDPAGAAADFQHVHLLRVLALTHIPEIVQDLFFERDAAGPEALLIGP